MTHTKGPWILRCDRIFGPKNVYIADVLDFTPKSKRLEEAAANARLIAAAPDLLEQLKVALQCIEYCRKVHPDVQSGTGTPVEAFIKDAIAKAEGR